MVYDLTGSIIVLFWKGVFEQPVLLLTNVVDYVGKLLVLLNPRRVLNAIQMKQTYIEGMTLVVFNALNQYFQSKSLTWWQSKII
eukprot:3939992-Rhodomonas_salina.1